MAAGWFSIATAWAAGCARVFAVLIAGALCVAAEAPYGGRGLHISEVETEWSRLDAAQRVLVLEQVAAAGDVDGVDRLVALGGLGHDGVYHGRFYRALALKRRGDHAAAVGLLRGILADRPDFARVRLELATSLFEMKEDDSARHHFDLVLAGSSVQPDLDRTVREFVAAMDSRRRWEFSSYLSVAPTTNLNQGTDKRLVMLNGLPFELDPSSMKKSGIGIVSGFQGSWRQPVSDGVDLVVGGGSHTKFYNDPSFNDVIASVTIGPRWRFDRGLLGVYGLAEQRWFGDEDYSRSLGGLVSGSWDVTGRE